MTPSFMADEVAEIPQAAARFLDRSAGAVTAAATALRALDPALFVTVARGSSDHAATYFKYASELLAGVPVASVGPSVASIYGRPLKLDRAACIGISQSGRSPDIVEMMRAAGVGGALTIAITNFADAPVAQASAHCLALEAGEEKSVAATKTFVISVLAALALLAEWQQDAALKAAVAGLPEAFATALTLDWSPLSGRLSRAQSLYVLGRGPGFAIASEAALKFKETAACMPKPIRRQRCCTAPAPLCRPAFRCSQWGSGMPPCPMGWQRQSGWPRRGRMCT